MQGQSISSPLRTSSKFGGRNGDLYTPVQIKPLHSLQACESASSTVYSASGGQTSPSSREVNNSPPRRPMRPVILFFNPDNLILIRTGRPNFFNAVLIRSHFKNPNHCCGMQHDAMHSLSLAPDLLNLQGLGFLLFLRALPESHRTISA